MHAPAPNLIRRLADAIHGRFLWLLLAAYAIAALWPAAGVALRDARLPITGAEQSGSLITLMLGLLLFNAGLGVPLSGLRTLFHRPAPLLTAAAINLLLPVCVLYLMMRFGQGSGQLEYVLLGLALVAAMPVAGSSTAWSQNAGGNLSLSLGLVVVSTLLSPLTIPLSLQFLSTAVSAEQQAQLAALAESYGGGFLVAWVVLPAATGMVVRQLIGERRTAAIRPALQLINSANLLLLNYSNASLTLPGLLKQPDFGLIGLLIALTLGLCGLAFSIGWLLGRAFKLDRARQISLMFALGMNNNGVGMALGARAWDAMSAASSMVLLPVIVYTLAQHVLAGIVDCALMRGRRAAQCAELAAESKSPAITELPAPVASAAVR